MYFLLAVQFEALLDSYISVSVKKDTWSENEVEGWLPTLALLGLEEVSDKSNDREHLADTLLKKETATNCRQQLAKNKKIAAHTKHEAAWQSKTNKNQVEQATRRIPDGLRVFVNGKTINLQQLQKLVELLQNKFKSVSTCTETYYLMRKFQRISYNFDAFLHDHMMALVCTPEYKHITLPLDLSSCYMNLVVMLTPKDYLQ